jgi:putative transcriptional regulator
MGFRAGDRTVFAYGFAKNERDNIGPEELEFWRRVAGVFAAMAERAYRTQRLESLHKTAAALLRVGALDKTTMRDLDAFCLTPMQPIGAEDIRALLQREGVSQAVLARHLNVGTKLVSDWERGVKRPSGPSLKLLVLARVNWLDGIA